MCGIAGIVSKEPTNVSSNIIRMLSFIQHRGPDASGIAVFSEDDTVLLRVSMDKEERLDELKNIMGSFGVILDEKIIPAGSSIPFAEFKLNIERENVKPLHKLINRNKGLAVHSIGNQIKVYKEGGHLDRLIEKHDIDDKLCRHGIGHVRMATESAEDINAAHPFVSPFYPQLAIVHNGQFTNYFKMRRFLESKGAIFKTLNDSEAASHLIAYAMQENNGDLESALKYAQDQMDGIFCIIAATDKQIGFVKDKLGIKPLLVVETEDYILMGSEQIEFNIIDGEIYAEEAGPGEVCVWNI